MKRVENQFLWVSLGGASGKTHKESWTPQNGALKTIWSSCTFLVFWKCKESQSTRNLGFGSGGQQVRLLPIGENGKVQGYENKHKHGILGEPNYISENGVQTDTGVCGPSGMRYLTWRLSWNPCPFPDFRMHKILKRRIIARDEIKGEKFQNGLNVFLLVPELWGRQ